MVRSARICSFSWPLPAIRTTSSGFADPQGEANGGGAIGLDGVMDAAGFERRFNFGENRARIFGARVVAGGHDKVASLARGLAHLGALGAVAIAAAAEERDDAAFGLCDESGARGR